MITAGDVVLAIKSATPMQTAGVLAPQFGAVACGLARTEDMRLRASPAAVADCAFIHSNSRAAVALEITGYASRALTGAVRPRWIDGDDAIAAHFADPGVPMQQM